MVSTIAVCTSMAVNIQLAVQLYLFYKELQIVKKEIIRKNEKIWRQEEEIQRLSYPSMFSSSKDSKNSGQNLV
ncbi:hypothetical protein HNQ69_001653 [Bartonella callosciuri]|uniref:Uncharacterized protein n=1 Tax=Bartonella callosciuri TaxID=686223 RepID=A0A840NTW5_9HYPH|nr:hypothetical protein [Bartonella callosciuri]